MRRLIKWLLRVIAVLMIAGGLFWQFGPRESVDTTVSFDPATLPEDLDVWLAAQEAEVPDLRENVEKRILWAGAPGQETDYAVVYLHGFSASSEEIRPVPDKVAEGLGANLYFARSAHHGRDGAAMASATANDWVNDTAEALAITKRLGRKVIVISTSTGGTALGLAALDPRQMEGIAGLVFVSPNFELAPPGSGLLTAPGARTFLPWLMGEVRRIDVTDPEYLKYWVTEYPVEALLPMAAFVKHVRALDFGTATTPALFLFSEEDKVVSAKRTRSIAESWGAPARVETLTMGEGDDPHSHVIAGRIVSPGQTEGTVALILDWARGL